MAGKVLVVDDDASVQRLLQFTLEQEGYEVVVASDGVEGLRRWQQDVAVAGPARRHHRPDGRLRGRHPDPRGGGRVSSHARDHADRGQGRPGQGPGAARGCGRLPDQAVPPGRAHRAHEEPHRALPAQRVTGRTAADGPDPRLLRRQGRRRHDDDRDQHGDRAPRPGSQRLPRGRQPAVRRPPGLPGPRPGPQEHRGPRQHPGHGRGRRQEHRHQSRLGRGPVARPAVARGRRSRHRGSSPPGPGAAVRRCTTT